jgi:hypothetical protein
MTSGYWLNTGTLKAIDHEHIFKLTADSYQGGELECVTCGKRAPYPFCHSPEECCAAGKCTAEFVCND